MQQYAGRVQVVMADLRMYQVGRVSCQAITSEIISLDVFLPMVFVARRLARLPAL